MPFWACSRPPEPSATTASHDPSGGVPAAARICSLAVTSGSASIRLTVMFVSGVNFLTVVFWYHWLWPVGLLTPGRVRTSMEIGPLLGAAVPTAPDVPCSPPLVHAASA